MRRSISDSPGRHQRGTILVAEHDPDVRASLRKVLVFLGYDVECASNGAEAVRRYAQSAAAGASFDLLIVNLTAPHGMDAVETMEALRALCPQAKALVTSGYRCDPVMSDFGRHGFSGAIPKPFTIEELDRQVRNALASPARA